jgi:hypothetical protein
MKVRVIIEKEGDWGYEHFNEFIPVELIPKYGEVIELFYPDGNVIQQKKVTNVYKIFTQNELIIKVEVVSAEFNDFLGDF